MKKNPRAAPANLERRSLLGMLIDDEVLAIVKTELTKEEIALLVLEEINPHRKLKTIQKAKLAGITERAYRDRKTRGDT